MSHSEGEGFPCKDIVEFTEDLWDRYRNHSNDPEVCPHYIRIILLMVDDLIRERIVEALEKVGAEAWKKRSTRAKRAKDYASRHRDSSKR